MKSGIYIIKNTINGKSYIGQAQDLHRRWLSHKSYLSAGNHHNLHLQNSWDKNGEKSFEFSILKICDVNDLDKEEQEAIDSFEGELYNIAKDVESPFRGHKHSKESLLKMIEYQNRPEVKSRQRDNLTLNFDSEAASKRMSEMHKNENFRKNLMERVNSPEWKKKATEHVNSFNKTEKHVKHLRSQASAGGRANLSVYDVNTCELCGRTVVGKGNFVRWHKSGKCVRVKT